MRKFPFIPDDLMKALEEHFPDKAPRAATDSVCELGIMIGQQQVMDFIRRMHDRQNPLEG